MNPYESPAECPDEVKKPSRLIAYSVAGLVASLIEFVAFFLLFNVLSTEKSYIPSIMMFLGSCLTAFMIFLFAFEIYGDLRK